MLQADVALRLGSLALEVQLEAAPGEIVAVLGPNAAGKTTLLRALAGLVPLERGSVTLDGVAFDDIARGIRLPPERRPIGVVFQDYLLFPHLTALENVAFGLRARGMSAREARVRARSWLDRLGIGETADTKPRALSGGQAQRVALARALAFDPRLLLLDEPLAALDASARGEVRRDLKRHLASFAGIRIVITHDPLEAVALADRLVILEGGRVVQTGSPADVTQRPRSRYVADLVGVNLLRGTATGGQVALPGGASLQSADRVDGDVFAVIHPRAVALHRARPEGSPRNVWRGRTSALDFQGDRVRVGVEGEMPIVAEVTPAAVRELDLAEGGEVWASVKATEITVYPA
ncbi:MAG: ABC transporter ATP-binding protein [Actinobacteria bacterium 13_2_20CM_2_66_6]|nr:MAG: ABC transporter ATP-binding protein [Actinobacteria bacterium 13_2_20CM_2_66_6]